MLPLCLHSSAASSAASTRSVVFKAFAVSVPKAQHHTLSSRNVFNSNATTQIVNVRSNVHFASLLFLPSQRLFATATTAASKTTEHQPELLEPINPPAERSAHSPESTADLIAAREEKPVVRSLPYKPQDDGDYLLPHPIWTGEFINKIDVNRHVEPKTLTDKLALWTIRTMRFNFDWMSGYSFGRLTRNKALSRIMFLETVAAVPGSIGGLLRHLASLRRMQRDHGWIHTLMEEAENERMHLLTAIQLKKPSLFFKGLVLVTQGVFFNFFWVAYLLSPKYCHRLVGYLEEEAVHTYTRILNEIDHGSIKEWSTEPAPAIAIKYWSMKPDATMRDVIAVIRADEAHHRNVNHTFADLRPDQLNPFKPGH